MPCFLNFYVYIEEPPMRSQNQWGMYTKNDLLYEQQTSYV